MGETVLDWQPSVLGDELVDLIPLIDTDFEILFQVATDPLIWEQHPANNRFEKAIPRSFIDHVLCEACPGFVCLYKNRSK